MPALKQEPVTVEWSGEELDFSRVPANTLPEVCKRVEKAFDRFIAGDSNGKRSGKPRFKSQSRYRSFIKRRKGSIVIVGSITDDTSKEVLRILRSA